MAKYAFNVYDSLAEAKTAVEEIDTSITLISYAFKEGGKQKVVVIVGGT